MLFVARNWQPNMQSRRLARCTAAAADKQAGRQTKLFMIYETHARN